MPYLESKDDEEEEQLLDKAPGARLESTEKIRSECYGGKKKKKDSQKQQQTNQQTSPAVYTSNEETHCV